MNILPFIIVIIMILGLFSLSQFQGAITEKKEHQLYLAYFRGLRETRNHKECTAYKKTSTKNQNNKPNDKPKPTEKKNYSIKYFRVKREGWEKGRLNLSSLLTKPDKYDALQTTAEDYIRELYGHASFFPKDKDFPKILIEALVEIYTYSKDPPQLYEIVFDHCTLSEPFFKMIHGTHTYDLEKKIGYPPFGEMFTFEKSNKPPMNFHYANHSFLKVTFGGKIKEELVKLELERLSLPTTKPKCRSPLKDEEIEELFLKSGQPPSIFSLYKLNYETSKRNPEDYVDPSTAITVKIK